MAKVKDLKKDINYVLGDIIENVYLWENNNGKPTKESEAIIDDAIATFDELIAKVNQKKVEDNRAHFRGIQNDLEAKATEFVERINNLG